MAIDSISRSGGGEQPRPISSRDQVDRPRFFQRLHSHPYHQQATHAQLQSPPGHEPQHVLVPSRSRSRLQKRPSSSHALRLSRSATLMGKSPASSAQRRSLDSQTLTALPQLPNHAIPDRSSSLRKKSRINIASAFTTGREKHAHHASRNSLVSGQGQTPDGAHSVTQKECSIEPTLPQQSSGEDTSSSTTSPDPNATAASQRTPRHLPLAPYDPSPLNPLYHIPSPTDGQVAGTMGPKSPPVSPPVQRSSRSNAEILLPPGFRPGYSARTEVETTLHSAVTQEVVKEHTVEIVREEVSREIHVHHYFTYIQPIKAVEILPARHFIVDERTGQKVEIPAPEGWVMPSSMQPTKPDTSGIAPSTRHYLVNEQFPRGRPEPPPSTLKKTTSQELKAIARASHTAKWTPFPKVR